MRCRQNWSNDCENALNEQIEREYSASLSYHALSAYFDRDDIGLKKLVDYFNKSSLEERDHANEFMHYQNKRGGVVQLNNIKPLEFDNEGPNDILNAFMFALELEKTINKHLLDLHQIASEANDPQFSDYLEGTYLKEQVDSISEISKIISVLERFNGDQHAIWNYIESL
jgi:ferritin heavy chain